MTDEEKWFAVIYDASNGYTQQAIACDAILDVIDDLLLEGKFYVCNDLLQRVDVSRLTATTMIGFLAATNPAKEKLPYREALFNKIKERLETEEPDRVERLLKGFA